MANSKAPYIIGGGLLLALLFSGKAKADSGPLPGPTPEPKPDDPAPQPAPEPDVDVDPGDNWGLTPVDLIPIFIKAEQASGIAGLGQFFAVKSWQAARAGQALLGPAEAAAWAASHPTLCQNCQNDSASEKKASFASLERNTLPKGQVGPNGGVGSHKAGQEWTKPTFYSEWGEIGSAGLFGLS
jgi:hypothetical protein